MDPVDTSRPSGEGSGIMNDPAEGAYDRSSDEVDTCRICRAEGTVEEPLFYPCKCNGSIKFVHQGCLMEWLSHTQKKHCELCKTPFRFTKLYHPQMPQELPTTIFLKKALIHVIALALTLLRWLLVGTVWFVVLPWCMRLVWRGLFWLGDGGWSRDMHAIAAVQSLQAAQRNSSVTDSLNTTLNSNLTSAQLFVTGLTPSVPPSLSANSSVEGSFALLLAKKVFETIGQQLVGHLGLFGANATTEDAQLLALISQRHSSILSDVSYLNSFFVSPALNRLLLDILEGIIISFLVVLAFILVFLIREWVVQQQPVINAAAADAANAVAQAEPLQPANEPQPEPAPERQDSPQADAAFEPATVNEEATTEGGAESANQNTAVPDRSEQLSNGQMGRIAQDVIEGLPEELQNVMQDRLAEVAGSSDIDPDSDLIGYEESLIRDHMARYADDVHHEEKPPLAERNARQANDEEEYPKSVSERANEILAAVLEVERARDALREAHRAVQRPNMPARERSFIATEIRRGLEERNFADDSLSGQPDNPVVQLNEPVLDSMARHPRLQDDGEGEVNSETTTESWQHLSDFSAGDDQSLTARTLDKGKAKALDPQEEEDDHGTMAAPDEYTTSPSASAPDDDTNFASQSATVNNPFHPDYEGDAVDSPNGSGAALVVHPRQPADTIQPEGTPAENAVATNRSWTSRAIDLFWGDVAPADPVGADEGHDDEHVVQDLDHEAPFVPFVDAAPEGEAPGPADNQVQDPEVAAAAAQAGIELDAEAVEDAEDLEGVLELIGLQGPITGLFQNAMFSAILISATITAAVWVPYLWGKVVILFIANPFGLLVKTPLRVASAIADFILDLSLFFVGSLAYWITDGASLTLEWIGWCLGANIPTRALEVAVPTIRSTAESALQRIANLFLMKGIVQSDFLHLSISSHAALRTIEADVSQSLVSCSDRLYVFYNIVATSKLGAVPGVVLAQISQATYALVEGLYTTIENSITSLTNTNLLKVSLDVSRKPPLAIDPTLAYWSATDRAIAVFLGYAFFAVAGALYLRRGTPVTNNERGHRIEAIITDVLQQAGGVLKVILIIGIEMIAFPLYCGLLLDLALLPLFESATIATRLHFMWHSPFLSTFVHWFIGTCYMFHFALFVSMCRKIMRSGVLYFIRDPDDPTFHPVRDVLERSVMTQLRKIAFSALVYGALVIVCLGGVVWGLCYAFDDILPIHWASSEATLEVPLDLLFYNFLTPLIVRNIKPSDGLQTMYEWWFIVCARTLRLSDFLFGDKRKDEPSQIVKQTWTNWLRAIGNPDAPAGSLVPPPMPADNGRWVLAPASDSVRIPRGASVFVETDANGRRLDGKPETEGFQPKTLVYIPSWFRVRIAVFVLIIWLFAATTGLGVTVVPLLFGRKALSFLLGDDVRINDVYAFSLGAYTLGGLVYLAVHHQSILSSLRTALSPSTPPTAKTRTARLLTTATQHLLRAMRLLYVYTSLTILAPLLLAFLAELYIISPLHAYLAPGAPHTIHLVQDWTLGILYLRLGLRSLLADPASRPARALRAVVRDGLADPSARLATRCFVLPGLLLFGVAAGLPWGLARALNATWFAGAGAEVQALVYRGAYPVCLAAVVGGWVGFELGGAARRWRGRIRDEVYLIGERLHNFGERRGAGEKVIGAASTSVSVGS